jgi:hypothetical protein
LSLTEAKEIELNAYYTIGNIANDAAIEAIPQTTPNVLNLLLDEMSAIGEKFAKSKSIEKIKCEFLNNEKRIDVLKASYLSRSTTPMLIGLTRFAVNETTRQAIFERGFASLRVIIFKVSLYIYTP